MLYISIYVHIYESIYLYSLFVGYLSNGLSALPILHGSQNEYHWIDLDLAANPSNGRHPIANGQRWLLSTAPSLILGLGQFQIRYILHLWCNLQYDYFVYFFLHFPILYHVNQLNVFVLLKIIVAKMFMNPICKMYIDSMLSFDYCL